MLYFDNSATTPVYPEVLATYDAVTEKFFGNPSSLHDLGEKSQALLQQSRQQIAQIMGCKVTEIFFTSGGTEGDNWAAKGTAFEKMDYGKHLITSTIEHPAVREAMKQLEKFGFEVSWIDVDKNGVVDLEALEAAIRPDTTLVSIMAVNNEIGAIQPIAKISEILKKHPQIHFHVDAVQAIGKVDLDLSTAGRIDLATYSGHKFHAPRGVGFLYIKEGRRLQPLLSGGGQERGERSGTENLAGIASMAKAVRLLFDQKDEKVAQMRALTQRLRADLADKKGVEIFTPTDGVAHILCFGIPGIRGEVLVHALENKDIFVSTTSACSSRNQDSESTLKAMKIAGDAATSAIRVSLSEESTEEEMTQFITTFNTVYKHFKPVI